jgi:DNA-binding protein HU-beta
MRANAEKVTTPALVREVAARMGCYKKDARELLDHFASVVAEQVAAGKRVQYAGLGVFYPAVSKRGRGAGKHVRIRFRPAKGLAEKIKKGGLQNEKPCTTD